MVAAVAVNGKLTYAVVEVRPPVDSTLDSQALKEPRFGKGPRNMGRALDQMPSTNSGTLAIRYLLVAEDLVSSLAAKLGRPLEVKSTFLGATLENCRYVALHGFPALIPSAQ